MSRPGNAVPDQTDTNSRLRQVRPMSPHFGLACCAGVEWKYPHTRSIEASSTVKELGYSTRDLSEGVGTPSSRSTYVYKLHHYTDDTYKCKSD